MFKREENNNKNKNNNLQLLMDWLKGIINLITWVGLIESN